MRRLRPATFLVLLGGAALLITWLVLGHTTLRRVQALQNQPASLQRPTRAEPAVVTIAEDRSNAETNAPSIPDDDAEIVAASPNNKIIARRPALDNVSGPDVLPGISPGILLENMRSVIRDYGQRFGGNPSGNNREISATVARRARRRAGRRRSPKIAEHHQRTNRRAIYLQYLRDYL